MFEEQDWVKKKIILKGISIAKPKIEPKRKH